MAKRLLITFSLLLLSSLTALAREGADTALVLPFENTSGKPEFNWVGESFADSLSELLTVSKMTTLSNEERKALQTRLRVPLTTLPSVATALKLANDSRATLLVLGRYTILPGDADTAATINVFTRIIRVKEGRYLSETYADGTTKIPPLELTDALGNLQSLQGQLAWKILFLNEGNALGSSINDLVTRANKVPGRAFEAYIKGLLTPASDAKENYFKNALKLFAEATSNEVYPEAALELGHLYLNQKKFSDAINSFERVASASQKCREKAKAENTRVPCGDRGYAEASFYIGLIFWQQGNYESALATLRPLTEDLKLTSVYNALGAISVQASRAEKKNPSRSAGLLTEGMELLKRASDSAPNDANVRFNYAMALFQLANYTEAATQLRSSIAANPRDGEAYFILAKTLESLKDPSVTDISNQAQRYLTENNRYAKLETEWKKSATISDINLRVEQPPRRDFVAVVFSRKPVVSTVAAVSESDALLAQARVMVKNGNDDEASAILRRVLTSEPMSAESHLLLGKINLRRGDIDQAISHFKTSIFWDNRLVEAHVSLGKIYVEKKDCLQAKNYSASAAEISADNQDVQALQRLSERCSK